MVNQKITLKLTFQARFVEVEKMICPISVDDKEKEILKKLTKSGEEFYKKYTKSTSKPKKY